MKQPAQALRTALESLASELTPTEPVLVLLYLDDVIVAVPPRLAGVVVPAAQTCFGEGIDGASGPGLALQPAKSQDWSPCGFRPRNVPSRSYDNYYQIY